MADGAIVIEIDADDKAVQKKLTALQEKIDSLEKSVSKAGSKGTGLTDKLRELREAQNEAGAIQREAVTAGCAGMDALRAAFRQGFGEAGTSASVLTGSLGALRSALSTAFAPVASVAVPLLGSLCSALATAAGYVARFLAALGGLGIAGGESTGLSKVAGAAKAAGAAVGGAAKAAEKAKSLFSGLDEINTFDSPNAASGGGGGGGSGGGDGGAGELAEELADAALTGQLKKLLWYALAVGAALAAWKIARGFGADLQTALGLAAAVGGAVLFVWQYLDAWQNGIDLSNLLGMLGSLALVVGGLGIAFGAAGAAVGLLVGGAALCVVALKEWIQTGTLSSEACAALVVGILAVGAGLTLLTGSWIPAVAAAAAALVVLVVQNWEEIRSKTVEIWNKVKGFVLDKLAEMKEKWNELPAWAQGLLQGVLALVTGGVSALIEKAVALYDAVSEKFGAIRDIISNDSLSAKDKALEIFGVMTEGIREKIGDARDAVKTAIDKIKGFFDFSWSLPTLKLPHISISGKFSLSPLTVPKFSVSWYKQGGILDGAQIFGMAGGKLLGGGEAGKEAVLPLSVLWDEMRSLLVGILDNGALVRSVDKVGAGLDALVEAVSAIPPMRPVMASGTVIPPRMLGSDTDSPALSGGIAGRRNAASGGNSYTFTAQLDGRTLFRKVVAEAELERTRTGRNPFGL